MITIEELRKVHDEAEAKAWDEMPHYMSHTDDSFLSRIRDASILAVARYVAERQRAVEPTEEMEAAAVPLLDSERWNSGAAVGRRLE